MPDHGGPFRGGTAVVGLGISQFTKRGQSGCEPMQLVLEAVLSACQDAGISPREIDGFASFSNETVDPARLAAALDINELRHSSLFWGGGGGGVCGALEQAASAIISGRAECVVVFRGIAQPNGKRYGQGSGYGDISDESRLLIPYGVFSPAQYFSFKIQRFFEVHGIDYNVMGDIALTSNMHAQNNPAAVMYGKPLTRDKYNNSRMIVEPLRLYDCCLETDGAAAVILCSADKVRHFAQQPAFLMSAVSGCEGRAGTGLHNNADFATANFELISKRMFKEAGISPAQVNVLQCYENFTGAVIMSIIESGFCQPEDANQFFNRKNLTLGGSLPINTSGGHLGEAYIQGMGLVVEAVRQIRGTSVNQVRDVIYSMVSGGALTAPASACVFASGAAI